MCYVIGQLGGPLLFLRFCWVYLLHGLMNTAPTTGLEREIDKRQGGNFPHLGESCAVVARVLTSRLRLKPYSVKVVVDP